jgi:uncharacterized membrane protein
MTKRLSLLTLIFAILSLTFFLLLVFLRVPFTAYPLMNWQDALDILTPLVLIPVYWLMYRGVTNDGRSLASEIVFMIMASFWAMGQGMHLAANSIDNLIGYLARDGVIDVSGTSLFTLTYFYDEYLSHYLWHIGVVGLAVLLIYESWRRPASEKTNWWLVVPAGILYGFTAFCFFDEGNTLILGLPFVTIITLLVLVWGRKKLSQQPVLAFFFVACLVAFLLFAVWRLYWGCFPPILDPTHC